MCARQILSFNSKLVRLKVETNEYYAEVTELFQFQTGSIKSNDRTAERRIRHQKFQFQTGSIKSISRRDGVGYFLTVFQFQTGSIKRCELCLVFKHGRSFNSKLVRLKEWGSVNYPTPIDVFQFQTGSIKRISVVSKVALPCVVSIPNWFD